MIRTLLLLAVAALVATPTRASHAIRVPHLAAITQQCGAAPPPPSVIERLLLSDLVVVGKVAKIEPETVDATPPYAGAKFQYLAANTVVTATGQTLFPSTWVKRFGSVSVGFIGIALTATPTVVTPAGVAGLRFGDEAEAINRVVPELRRQGVEAIVVLMHEGGIPGGDINDCAVSPALVDLVKRMEDNEIDILIGTQIVAKGHNFPNLTFVGVVDADSGLKGGDLRAGERTFQLVSQVAGRAGRHEKKGRALIQTYAPHEPVMQALHRLRHRGHDVMFFHILAPEELEFPFTKPTKFRDMERLDRVVPSDTRSLREEYLRNVENWRNDLRKKLEDVRADYVLLRTDVPVDRALGAFLARRNS